MNKICRYSNSDSEKSNILSFFLMKAKDRSQKDVMSKLDFKTDFKHKGKAVLGT